MPYAGPATSDIHHNCNMMHTGVVSVTEETVREVKCPPGPFTPEYKLS